MRSSLGLSVGTAHLVAAYGGRATVRRAMLTLFPHRGPEVGLPRLDQPGLVLGGFVERVGDPVPIVAADGSRHLGDRLLAVAIETLTRTVSPQARPDAAAVAVPAHWPAGVVAALHAQLPGVAVVSESVAALTALQDQPGLPTRGVVALCDVGATGTSITLADAAVGFRTIGETVRVEDFSGDLADRTLLTHVLGGLEVDPARTSAVATLSGLRDQCRDAKERLSEQTATTVAVPGGSMRITRAELEELLRGPFDEVIAVLLDTLRRNGIVPAQLAAVATVGGGARMPLVTQRLSEALRAPVTTTPRAPVLAAIGAELIAGRGGEHETVTRLNAAPQLPTIVVAPIPQPVLAWSAEETEDLAVTEYAPLYEPGDARPEVSFERSEPVDKPTSARFRRPGALFAGAACVAAAAVTGFILTSNGAAEVADSSASVANLPVESSVEPQAPPAAAPAPAAVTQTIVAPAPAAAAPAPAPVPERRAVSQQSAPRPAAATAPAAPPAAAPAPAPAPAAPPFDWSTVPMPTFVLPPQSTLTPKPEPTPTATPEPTTEPVPEPSPDPQPTATPEPSPVPQPTATPEPTAEPTPEPTAEPSASAEPTVEAPAVECVPSADAAC